jgi:hypothetical protein
VPVDAATGPTWESGPEQDLIIANPSCAAEIASAAAMSDEIWHGAFDELVHPHMELIRATLPRRITPERLSVPS